MRVLHVSNFVQKYNGRLYWNMPFRVSNGFTRLGHNVLNFSDRDLSKDNFLRSSFIGIKEVNRRLLITCINYNPELIIIGHADSISNETLNEIKSTYPKCKIIQWNVDHLLMNSTLDKLINRSKYVSNSFITTGDKEISKAAVNGMKIHYIPNIFDASIDSLKVFNNSLYEFDIFFAMSHGVGSGKLKSGKFDGREKLLKNISLNTNISENFYGFNNIEPIWGQSFIKQLNKNLMGLNLSSGKPMYLYSSDRICLYMGNGLLTYINESYGFNDLYTKDDIIFYKDDYDLMDKIIFYKNNLEKAKEIAKNGWLKSHNNFNEKNICNFMIDKTFNIKSGKINWPDISY